MSNPTSIKSTTGIRGGKAGTSFGSLIEVAASLVRSSEMLCGAGAEVAATSSLDVGLLGLSAEALAASAADVGLDVSSLDDGREWS